MASYTIQYACGCERRANLYGSLHERSRKEAWLKTQTCPVCQQKMQPAKPPLVLVRPIMDDASIEVIVFRSFPIKDQLKARQYFFHGKDTSEYRMPRESQTPDLLKLAMQPPDPAWARSVSLNDIKEEIEYLKTLDCEFQFSGLADNIMAALAEGRPDLLPEKLD